MWISQFHPALVVILLFKKSLKKWLTQALRTVLILHIQFFRIVKLHKQLIIFIKANLLDLKE